MQRRIRAVLVTTVLWASAWGLVGLVQGLVWWLRYYREGYMASGFVMWEFQAMLLYAIVGALCGSGFALLLARAERDRTIDDLSLSRTALWGAVAGIGSILLIAGIKVIVTGHVYLMSLPVVAAVCGVVGALSAGASLAAARTARLAQPPETPRLPAT